MPKRTMIVYEDDLTGEDIPEDEAHHVILALQVNGGEVEAWELVLSAGSLEQWRTANKAFTKDDLTVQVRLVRSRYPAVQPGTSGEPGNTPGDTAEVRTWWRGLTAGQRVDNGNLPEPPDTRKGPVPAVVREAYYLSKESG